MDQELFERLKNHYTPIIEKMIFENERFFFQSLPIPWEFLWKEKPEFVASYSRKTKRVNINLYAVDFGYSIGQPLIIEWFLIHEIRHRFQDINVEKYYLNPSNCVDVEYAKRCIESYNNYIPPVDEYGQGNPGYYYNYEEFDAFSYSYAVMLLKYGDVSYLKPPVYYDVDFYNVVDEHIRILKSKL